MSDDLNAAMEELFQLCTALDIPILSHAAASNGAGPHYSDRGDPAFWLPALVKYPTLRLCLAHFGRFTYRSAAAEQDSSLPESSWEWTLGRYMKSNREGRLFADLSYLTEAQTSDADSRRKLGRQMRQYISEFDPKLERLLYGSDWIMLGKEPRNESFATDIVRFLKSEVGLTLPTMERVLRSNAIRFLGLTPGNATRARLTSFYKRHDMNPQRLEVFDATI
ncbi:putative TIM-barrel fold metal-dependent hydrolase [Bradyrhizobium sp. AZCC 2289]